MAETTKAQVSEGLPPWFLRDVEEAMQEAPAPWNRRWEGFRICPACGRGSLRVRAQVFELAWDEEGLGSDLLPDIVEVNCRCLRCGWRWVSEEESWE